MPNKTLYFPPYHIVSGVNLLFRDGVVVPPQSGAGPQTKLAPGRGRIPDRARPHRLVSPFLRLPSSLIPYQTLMTASDAPCRVRHMVNGRISR